MTDTDPAVQKHGPKALVRWLGGRKLELAIFLLGVALRISMRFTYEPTAAYDFPWHWELVEWMIEHRRVAPADTMLQSQHPPLFYTIAALLFANGVSLANIAWLPVTCGVLRLGLTWAAIELYLPHSRWARASALSLAAVMAASVHVDGMIYPEAVNCLWASIAILLAPLAFRSPLRKRLRIALVVGVVLGVEMLTKVSGLTIVAALCLIAGLELLFSRRRSLSAGVPRPVGQPWSGYALGSVAGIMRAMSSASAVPS